MEADRKKIGKRQQTSTGNKKGPYLGHTTCCVVLVVWTAPLPPPHWKKVLFLQKKKKTNLKQNVNLHFSINMMTHPWCFFSYLFQNLFTLGFSQRRWHDQRLQVEPATIYRIQGPQRNLELLVQVPTLQEGKKSLRELLNKYYNLPLAPYKKLLF